MIGPTPLDVANALVTGYDLVDRHQPAIAVLIVAAAFALAWRALRRAVRYVDDLADEQQQIASTRKETSRP